METLIYLAKVNLYWILFYACYWILLKKHTFFRLNRFYLVGALLLSFVLPFVQFVETITVMPAVADSIVNTSDFLVNATVKQFDWSRLLIIIYATGIAYMFFNLTKGFYNLNRVIKQGEHLKLEKYTLILLPEVLSKPNGIGSFSFFNFLIVSNNDYENNFDTILQHEQVHLKQAHSLDILLIELLKVFFWFNPVLWCYKFSMREVHEFLADQHVENKNFYTKFLVNYAQNASVQLVTNHFFNSSLLKQRVKMIYKNRTSNWLLYKYMMIIPVIAFTVLMTAERKRLIVVADNQVNILSLEQTNQDIKPKISDPLVLKAEEIPVKNTLKTNRVNRQFAEKQDTLKSKKTKYIKYRVIPVKLETANTSIPTIEKLGAFFNNTVDLSQKEMQPLKTPYGAYQYNNGAALVEGNNNFRNVIPAEKIDTLSSPK